MLQPNIQYITTPAAVQAAADAMHRAPRIAVDLEFDDMRHRYGRNLALIQIFDGPSVYLIDPFRSPIRPRLRAYLGATARPGY